MMIKVSDHVLINKESIESIVLSDSSREMNVFLKSGKMHRFTTDYMGGADEALKMLLN